MTFRFPIEEVKILTTHTKKRVATPLNCNHSYCLNQRELTLDIEDVGWFYARNGNYIEVVRYPGVDTGTLQLYLNGSVYGAILHQRKILPPARKQLSLQGKGNHDLRRIGFG